MADALARQREWQLRKVESRYLLEGHYHVIKVSIDCVPQGANGLRYTLDNPRGGERIRNDYDEDHYLIPVTYMRKGAVRGFDMRGPEGESLPVIGRSEYQALMTDALRFELAPAVAENCDEVELALALGTVLDGDRDVASQVALRLANEGTFEGRTLLKREALSEPARRLLVYLAEFYVLIAVIPGRYTNRRVVLKYQHTSLETIVPGPAALWLATCGFAPLPVSFDLGHPEGSRSHHLEVHVPPELDCRRLTMPEVEAMDDRNVEDRSSARVVHAVASYTENPLQGAAAEFWVPWQGIRQTAFWASATTFVILALGLWLPDAQDALIAANDGAAAILLAVPAVVLASIAGRGENALVSAVLAPLRRWIVMCALLLLACAGSIVGELDQPFRSALWFVGVGISGTGVAVLLLSVLTGSMRSTGMTPEEETGNG